MFRLHLFTPPLVVRQHWPARRDSDIGAPREMRMIVGRSQLIVSTESPLSARRILLKSITEVRLHKTGQLQAT